MSRIHYNQTNNERYIEPSDINITAGYKIEAYIEGLDLPSGLLFTPEGNMLIAESGVNSREPKILQYINNELRTLLEGFALPINGFNYLNGEFYVSQRGTILRIKPGETGQNIISGLPSYGDFLNSTVVFGLDGKMYFGQGTATNSGVVGYDNDWVRQHPFFCDFPGDTVLVYGQNYSSYNIFNELDPYEIVYTGGYSPYGIPNYPNEIKKGIIKASGSILKANTDGTEIELVAWGFRNPYNLKFNRSGQLYVANIGYDSRGLRPIANAPDEFSLVNNGRWYGWPDYAGGEPVTLPRFKPEGRNQPEFLIKHHPDNMGLPFVTFPTYSNIMGFDFNYSDFGTIGDVYIAEYGSVARQLQETTQAYAGTGHRISKISMQTRTVSTFAINKSGFSATITKEGGFGRPINIVFGPDHAMYILDVGVDDPENLGTILPNTGVVWRVTRI